MQIYINVFMISANAFCLSAPILFLTRKFIQLSLLYNFRLQGTCWIALRLYGAVITNTFSCSRQMPYKKTLLYNNSYRIFKISVPQKELLHASHTKMCINEHVGGVCVKMCIIKLIFVFKLMRGKSLRKHSLHEKTAASVLLKLFISGNE